MTDQKKFLEDISLWLAQKEQATGRPSKNQRLVEFLKHKSHIEAALEKGYSAKTIWEHLKSEDQIHCTYETFARLIRENIQKPTSHPATDNWAT